MNYSISNIIYDVRMDSNNSIINADTDDLSNSDYDSKISIPDSILSIPLLKEKEKKITNKYYQFLTKTIISFCILFGCLLAFCIIL